jgi:hypothetical protein
MLVHIAVPAFVQDSAKRAFPEPDCYLLHAGFLTWFGLSCLEATCSSETSGDFQRTTWRYIPQDTTLQNI